MRNKRIILSFDYELFFGMRSGTIQKTIIEPTYLLLDTMEHAGLRGDFFVDYLMLHSLEKNNDSISRKDLEALKKQLRDLVRRGHRIELHLHPHWIDALYNGDGTWDFTDFRHYSLSSLNESTINTLFKEGTDYLNSIAKEVDPNYRICAFRAGGWAVQPFDKLENAFADSEIQIDSSTSYGIFKYTKNYYYDFRNIPKKASYRFTDDVSCEEKDGKYLEIPITSFHRSVVLAFFDRVFAKLGFFKTKADGTHRRIETGLDNNKPSFTEKCKKQYKMMFALSMQSPLTIFFALFFHKKEELFCYIDHPKDQSRATIIGIRLLGCFCKSTHYVDLIKSNL